MDSGNRISADQAKNNAETVVSGPFVGNANFPLLQGGEIVAERYKVIKVLGHGGMGAVYKVEQIFFRQLFALKTLSGQDYPDVAIRRFQKEAQAAMKLNHPNLVRAHDFGILPSHHPFYIMDLVEGENLSEYTRRTGTLTIGEILNIFIPVCFALAYAHSEGIIHRDIKPGNIMLDKSAGANEPYVPKVVDFGIAKLTDSESGESVNLTRTGEIFGTPLYMSPEQCLGTKLDHRTDIYSLGCVMYEVLTGAPPFHGETALNLMMKHQSELPASLKEGSMGREFPDALEAIVAKTLEKDPDRRYQNFLELAEDLAVLQRSTVDSTSTNTVAKTMAKTMGQISRSGPKNGFGNSWILPVIVGIVCLTAGIVLGTLVPRQTTEVSSKKTDEPDKGAEQLEKDCDLINTGQYLQGLEGEGPAALRVFQFPSTFPIGTLEYFDVYGNLVKEREAKGTVKIPLKSPITLTVIQSRLGAYPNLLRAFGNYDISRLNLKREPKAISFNYGLEFEVALAYCTRWQALNFLDLCGTRISDDGLRFIKDCPNLFNAEFIDTRVTAAGVRLLKCFPNFATIGISGIKGGSSLIPEIGKSKFLNNFGGRDLDLTDNDIRHFCNAKNLVILGLRNNKRITDKSVEYFKQMPSLAVLDVCKTSVSPKSISALASMRKLSSLEVGGDLWTVEDANKLQSLSPGLKVRVSEDSD